MVVDLNLHPLQIMQLLQLDLVEVEVDMVPKVQVDHKEIMVLLVVMTLVVEEEE